MSGSAGVRFILILCERKTSMDNPQTIIIMAGTCALFVFVLLIYNLFKYDKHDKADYFFSLLCAVIIVQLLSVAPFYQFAGLKEPWYPYIFKLTVLVQFLTGGAVSLIYTNYLCCYLKIDQGKRRRIRTSMFEYGALYEIIVMLNLRFGYYYTINEENLYTRGDFWFVAQLLAILPMIYDIVLFVRFRKSIYKSAWLGTIIYLGLPIIGAFLHYKTGTPVTFVFAAVGIYILFFNIKSEQSFLLERQQKELAESKISIMLSQIQPHFMYNSLTTIAVLCDKNPAEAKRATLNFSRYLRKNIDSVNKRMPVSFDSELEHVTTYLELEKLRFGNRLNIVMDIQSSDFLIPPLTVQPLVENAVKHGICNKVSGTGTVVISSCEKEDCFEVKISDDGVGFETDQRQDDGKVHIGLENVRDRLSAMSNASMKVESTVGVGTVITVSIPKTTAKKALDQCIQ